MLAYVFWHWPQSEINGHSYIQLLSEFHRTLSTNKSAGFFNSVVFRINNARWLQTEGEAFEEWYLLADSASLDRLNDAAVSGACEEPHNKVARYAAGGVAGLYRLRAGQLDLTNAKYAYWFSKPAGMLYSEMYSSLQPLTSQDGVALWGRQMTLGPTTEFCLRSGSSLSVPQNITTDTIKLELIWPGR